MVQFAQITAEHHCLNLATLINLAKVEDFCFLNNFCIIQLDLISFLLPLILHHVKTIYHRFYFLYQFHLSFLPFTSLVLPVESFRLHLGVHCSK